MLEWYKSFSQEVYTQNKSKSFKYEKYGMLGGFVVGCGVDVIIASTIRWDSLPSGVFPIIMILAPVLGVASGALALPYIVKKCAHPEGISTNTVKIEPEEAKANNLAESSMTETSIDISEGTSSKLR